MGGTRRGGIAAAKTNKEKYGSDFYANIGKIGGHKGRNGGFGAGAEGRARAAIYGSIGGAMSRRGTKLTEEQRLEARLEAIKRQVKRTEDKRIRQQLERQQREMSRMQVKVLSEKYGARLKG